ncbi:MAG: hypothetical protein JO084_10790 [Bradyrhizobiaceae bacterium]|nr:hypothetical protein [Hyphomicrobiales bacterium]MBV9428202.1 hypothetical protein [Bradyrhizobiaceae bacterium]
MRRMLLALLLVIGLPPVAAAQQMLPAWSIWKNQQTSLLIVTVVNEHDFIGTFINNAQGDPCKGVGVRISGSVWGSLAGPEVTFVANFAPCSNRIIWWLGYMNNYENGNKIVGNYKLWYVDDQGNLHQEQNEDTFTKMN